MTYQSTVAQHSHNPHAIATKPQPAHLGASRRITEKPCGVRPVNMGKTKVLPKITRGVAHVNLGSGMIQIGVTWWPFYGTHRAARYLYWFLLPDPELNPIGNGSVV